MPQLPAQWTELFRQPTPGRVGNLRQEFRVFKKRGEPLLIISSGTPAGPALRLYPAQSATARLARFVWRQALRLDLNAGGERVTMELAKEDPFVKWLAALSQAEPAAGGEADFPRFALLAGNAQVPGRRFVLLVFDTGRRPGVVVKTGIDPKAVALIEKEFSFLKNAPANAPGLPGLLGGHSEGPLSAFAMRYVEGASPRPAEAGGALKLLESWLGFGRKTVLRELPSWERLVQASAGDPVCQRLVGRLEGLTVQAPLFHGDFTPWNIRVSRRESTWTVLDWERGEPAGPPGFDWFHYVLQPAILVGRQSASALARTAGELLAASPFRRYAQAAGVAGYERALLLAYLVYCRDVLRPAEGSPRIPELLRELSECWASI